MVGYVKDANKMRLFSCKVMNTEFECSDGMFSLNIYFYFNN